MGVNKNDENTEEASGCLDSKVNGAISYVEHGNVIALKAQNNSVISLYSVLIYFNVK